MTKVVLAMLLGAVCASSWWAMAVLHLIPVFPVFSSAIVLGWIIYETAKTCNYD